jgi:hypothetical protein
VPYYIVGWGVPAVVAALPFSQQLYHSLGYAIPSIAARDVQLMTWCYIQKGVHI